MNKLLRFVPASIITFIFMFASLLDAGLVGDTKILTPRGLVPVKQLRSGDLIIGYDLKAGKLLEVPIKKNRKFKEEYGVRLTTEHGVLEASVDQKFYDYGMGIDKPAKDFCGGDELLHLPTNDLKRVSKGFEFACESGCTHVAPIMQGCTFYEIQLAQDAPTHYYFAGEGLVLTHNVAAVAWYYVYFRACMFIAEHQQLIMEGIDAVVAVAQAINHVKDVMDAAEIVRKKAAQEAAEKAAKDGAKEAAKEVIKEAGEQGASPSPMPELPPDDPELDNQDPVKKDYKSPKFASRREKFDNQETPKLKKSDRSFEKLIKEHKQKIKEFKVNPDAHDNKHYLKNAPHVRDQIIKNRIKVLEKQIERQTDDLNMIREILKERGE